jgi:ankyrin repeat protein
VAIVILSAEDALGVAVVEAIHGGDADDLRRLLAEHAGLATASIGPRSLLHVATDWPGHFPGVARTVVALIAAGADVNARFTGRHTETPLHWAASSDDVAALDALLDAGADIEAPGAVIGGGTPLADAVAFGQWQAARRLVERGARTTLWQAAALGLEARVEEDFAGAVPPTPDELKNALWCACHGGQRGTAEYLLERGADINWIGHDGLMPTDAARRSGAEHLVAWLSARGGKSAKELS